MNYHQTLKPLLPIQNCSLHIIFIDLDADIFKIGLLCPSSSSLNKYFTFNNVSQEFLVSEQMTDELHSPSSQALINFILSLYQHTFRWIHLVFVTLSIQNNTTNIFLVYFFNFLHWIYSKFESLNQKKSLNPNL